MAKRESSIEKNFCKAIKSSGGRAYKFTSPGCRAVPDRLVLLPISSEGDRKLVAKYFYFCELKAPGKKPRIAQEKEFEKIRSLGFEVRIIDQ